MWGDSNAGFFGGLFDFNGDGKMDSLERAIELATIDDMLREEEEEERRQNALLFDDEGKDDELDF